MARIPGVPTLEPVNKPMMSPAEAGRPGEAIAQLGAGSNETALTGLDFGMYVKRAQQHVDSLAAQNDLARVYADTQNQLSRTQNSRDVPDIIEQSNKNLNDVSARWSKSPASVQIQMSADALRPDLSRIGTVKQVDLMGKELKITLDQQAEVLSANYAADRAAGGSGDMVLGAFATAVHGGVTTGLLGNVEAQEYVRQFRQKGQELQIRNAIANSSPEVNQKIYDEITAHRDHFPDVTQEQLDTLKGHAQAAVEAHVKYQDWAEGEIARRQQLAPKINQFTNPATGRFDEGAAMTDNAERFAKGEITETQSRVLASGFSSHAAQLQVGLKAEAGKRLDDIEKDLSAHKFQEAQQKLEENQPWFEANGLSDDYRAALRYTSQKKAEVRAEASADRAEARYEHEYRRQVQQEQSQDTLGQVQHFIASGGVLTKSEIFDLAGTGKGRMSTRDVDAAWKMMDTYEKEPDFAAGLKYLDDNFRVPTGAAAKTASPDFIASQNRKYAETAELFNQEVNKHPEKSKLEIAHEIVKSANEQQIRDHADRMFGTVPSSSRIFGTIKDFLSTPFTYGLKPGDPGYKAPPNAPAAPKEGDTKKNSAGDTIKYQGGKWVLQP